MIPDDPDDFGAFTYMVCVLSVFALLAWYIVTTNPDAFALYPVP